MLMPLSDDNSDRKIRPFVTYTVIALNVLVFVLLQHGGDSQFTYAWSFVPREITTGRDLIGIFRIADSQLLLFDSPTPVYLTLFSAMFMHSNFVHISGNMLYLWIFGDNVEDRMGHTKFLMFYLVCGLLASIAQIAIGPSSIIPNLGASGAIAGVLGAYLILFPKKSISVMVFGRLSVFPAIVVIGLWVLLQLIGGYGQLGRDGGGVAYMAHGGGFIAGMVLLFVFRNSVRPMLRAKSRRAVTDLEAEIAFDEALFRSMTALLDRFDIRGIVCHAGTGVVYCAFDRLRDNYVSLKQLHPSLLCSPRARALFLNEARLSSKLIHPAIARVFNATLDNNDIFVLMEQLEGETLGTQMARRKKEGKPYTLREVKALLTPLCAALGYAHKQTVHSNINPENVWIGANGTVKLMDFGIAKAMSASQLTETGTEMGTANYLAPELLKSAGKLDRRADQYAVALLAYALLSGTAPAGAKKYLYLQAKGVPRAFSDVIMKALAANPKQRYPNMAAFATALGLGSAEGRSNPLRWRMIGLAAVLVVWQSILAPVIDREDKRTSLFSRPSFLMDAKGGVLIQPVTGLEWTQSDNGRDIDWRGASNWCDSLSAGWRLPSVDELSSVYDLKGTVTTDCGENICKVSPLFHLTGPMFWSSDGKVSSEEWSVSLNRDYRSSNTVSNFHDKRVLCVRWYTPGTE